MCVHVHVCVRVRSPGLSGACESAGLLQAESGSDSDTRRPCPATADED